MSLIEDPEAFSRTIGDALALLHAGRMRPATDEDRDALEQQYLAQGRPELEAREAADVKYVNADPEAQLYMARNLADPVATAMILAIWRAGLLSDPERASAAAKQLTDGIDPTFFALYQAGRLRTELEFPHSSGFAGIRRDKS